MSNTHTNFAELLDGSMNQKKSLEGILVEGLIISIDKDTVTVDVGLKSEGRVPLKEFAAFGREAEIKIGDKIKVYVERLEDKRGETVLSVEKARREEAWFDLEKACEAGTLINGSIFGKVKGGFAVDLNGAVAFLPGSQVDIRPIRDITPLMNLVQPFKLLKMDKSRNNIVVSRRAVLEENRAGAKADLISGLTEGQVLEGIVKNITDYGAFIDLGGVDGLLHVTDISWKRINHPSDVLSLGQNVQVMVIRFNRETQRISLGMKQLAADPWEAVQIRYIVGSRHKGKVTNITEYGAFVELESAVEGLIYVTEMSWTKKNIHPSKILTLDQEVEIVVLEVDFEKRRISLGLKQCQENPWESFAHNCKVGDTVEGEIKNITEFGLFVGVSGELDGMVHLSDLSWEKTGEEAIAEYQKGQKIKVKILDIDSDKERISLGIKQLTNDPFQETTLKKGAIVTGTVSAIMEDSVELNLPDGLIGVIKKVDLSRDRGFQKTDRFAVGEKVDAKIMSFEKTTRKVKLSIKAKEIDEEKTAMSEYGSSDSGASLGDILGAAIKKANAEKKDK